MSYKSCGNCLMSENGKCGIVRGLTFFECKRFYEWWMPIRCPSCGGVLSEIRTDGEKQWRHCYSCHFEFEEAKS